MSRRERCIALLRSYRDVCETLQRGDTGGTFYPDSRLLQMPNAWHAGSYAELEDALRRLRSMGPAHYWNLSERYLRSQRGPRHLVNFGGRYVIDVKRNAEGRLEPTETLGCNAEVILARQERDGAIPTRPGEPNATRVIALVERWDARVRLRTVETAVDFVLAFMPKVIRLPREVYEEAVGSRAA